MCVRHTIDRAHPLIIHTSKPPHIHQTQTAVVRKDFGVANALLPNIPESELSNVARFLESQGYKEEALVVSRCVRGAIFVFVIDRIHTLTPISPLHAPNPTHPNATATRTRSSSWRWT